MLSKLVASVAFKQHATRVMYRAPMMVSQPQRGFLDRLGLEGQSTEVALDGKAGEVSLW